MLKIIFKQAIHIVARFGNMLKTFILERKSYILTILFAFILSLIVSHMLHRPLDSAEIDMISSKMINPNYIHQPRVTAADLRSTRECAQINDFILKTQIKVADLEKLYVKTKNAEDKAEFQKVINCFKVPHSHATQIIRENYRNKTRRW